MTAVTEVSLGLAVVAAVEWICVVVVRVVLASIKVVVVVLVGVLTPLEVEKNVELPVDDVVVVVSVVLAELMDVAEAEEALTLTWAGESLFSILSGLGLLLNVELSLRELDGGSSVVEEEEVTDTTEESVEGPFLSSDCGVLTVGMDRELVSLCGDDMSVVLAVVLTGTVVVMTGVVVVLELEESMVAEVVVALLCVMVMGEGVLVRNAWRALAAASSKGHFCGSCFVLNCKREHHKKKISSVKLYKTK